MKPKAKVYPNGWSVTLEREGIWYVARVRKGNGVIHDRVRCDDSRMAREYFAAFNRIAKTA